jgi:hypothetical protein
MSNSSRRSRRRNSQPPLFIKKMPYIAVSAFVLAGFCGVFLYNDQVSAIQKNTDSSTLCLKTGSSDATIILLDRTDSYSDIQRFAIENEIFELARSVPKGGLLKIYELGQDGRLLDPVVNVCNPGDGENSSALTENKRLLQGVYNSKYQEPIKKVINDMSGDVTAPQSLLLEAVQEIAVRDFDKNKGLSTKRLVIISDLLEYNPKSADLNFYKKISSFSQFKDSPDARALRSNLDNTNIDLRLLYRTKTDGLQNDSLVQFWMLWLRDQGGTINYKSIPG